MGPNNEAYSFLGTGDYRPPKVNRQNKARRYMHNHSFNP